LLTKIKGLLLLSREDEDLLCDTYEAMVAELDDKENQLMALYSEIQQARKQATPVMLGEKFDLAGTQVLRIFQKRGVSMRKVKFTTQFRENLSANQD